MLHHNSPTPQQPARVVIVGASGFIGKALAQRLASDGVKVLALASRDLDLLAPNAGVQLAAMIHPEDTLVVASALTPEKGKDVRTFMRNLTMVEHVCEALESKPCAHTVYLSSDAVYEDCSNPVREETLPAPSSLYGLMHLAREKMLASAVSKARSPFVIIRPCAVYGPGDTHNSYGPNRFIRTARQQRTISLFGEGEEQRHHVFIKDLIEILVGCLQWRSQGVLNAVGLSAISFGDLARLIAGQIEGGVQVICQPRQSPVTHRHYDVTQLVATFPHVPHTSLEEGLKQTIPHL